MLFQMLGSKRDRLPEKEFDVKLVATEDDVLLLPRSEGETEIDAYKRMDALAAKDDLASLKSELANAHERFPSLKPEQRHMFERFAADLFDDSANLEQDLEDLRGRMREVTLDEEACYALLSISKLPGMAKVRGELQDAAYHVADHPNREAALLALRRDGETTAARILEDIEEAKRNKRKEFLDSLQQTEGDKH